MSIGRLHTLKFISRATLQANPNTLFVFGDNLQKAGFGGQAKEMRGEPNAIGIPTKRAPSMAESAFFTDADFPSVGQLYVVLFRTLREHLISGRDVVFPADGLGTGRAQLEQRAPKVFALLNMYQSMLEREFGGGTKTNPKDSWAQVAKLLALADPDKNSNAQERTVAAGQAQEMAERLAAAGVKPPRSKKLKSSTPVVGTSRPIRTPTVPGRRARGPDVAPHVSTEAAADATLGPCSDTPDLFILPITPGMLYGYLQAETLYLSDTAPVRTTIETSATYDAAVATLSHSVGPGRARTLLSLALAENPATSARAWEELSVLPDTGAARVDIRSNPRALRNMSRSAFGQVRPALGWSRNGKVTPPPDFGIYSKYFGSVGSRQAYISSFGTMGAPPARGAPSLQALYNTWDRSRGGGGQVPTFYLLEIAGKPPTAVVVTGRADAWRALYPGESTGGQVRAAYMDALPVLSAADAVGADSLCLLLPSPIVVKSYAGKKDITGRDAYGRYLLQLSAPGFVHKLRDQVLGRSTRGEDLPEAISIGAFSIPAALFYGADEAIQRWPEQFIGYVRNSFKAGWTRAQAHERLVEAGATYPDVVEAVKEDDTGRAAAKKLLFLIRGVPTRAEAEGGVQKPRAMHLGDIPAEELAQVRFVQDGTFSTEEAPDLRAAPLVPARIRIYDAEGNIRSEHFPGGAGIIVKYEEMEAGGAKPKGFLPAVDAEVGLYKLSALRARLGADAVKVVEKQGVKLPGLGGQWYMAIPAAVSEEKDWKGGNNTYRNLHPFHLGKPNILRVSRRLLRVDVQPSTSAWHLRWLPGELSQGGSVWSSKESPYLLEQLPAPIFQKVEGGGKQKVGEAWVEMGTPEHGEVLKSAFAPSRTPDIVVEGRRAVHAGREVGGGAVRGRKYRPLSGGMAVSKPYEPRGLYLLAQRALAGPSTGAKKEPLPVEKMPESLGWLGSLHEVLRGNWSQVLAEMNADRVDAGQPTLPWDLPPPISAGSEDELRVEHEALNILAKLGKNKALFVKSRLLRPWQEGVEPDEQNLPKQYPEAFAPDVLEGIRAIENRGRRVRPPRPPRRSSRARAMR